MADLKNTKTSTNTSTGRKPLSTRTNTAPASAQVRNSRSASLHSERKSKSRDGSKCPSPTKAEEKRIPPIKAPVGLAKGPDLKNVRSKVGSFQNVKHVPAGGEKKLVTQKLEWKATSKIGSLDYAKHKPGGGDVKVETRKLDWKVNSKVGSLDNVKHRPGGGAIKIFNERYGNSRSSSEIRASTSTSSPSPPGSSTPNGKHESRKNSLEIKTKLSINQTKSANTDKPSENVANKMPVRNGNCTEQLLGNVQSSLSQLVLENGKTNSSAPVADLLA